MCFGGTLVVGYPGKGIKPPSVYRARELSLDTHNPPLMLGAIKLASLVSATKVNFPASYRHKPRVVETQMFSCLSSARSRTGSDNPSSTEKIMKRPFWYRLSL